MAMTMLLLMTHVRMVAWRYSSDNCMLITLFVDGIRTNDRYSCSFVFVPGTFVSQPGEIILYESASVIHGRPEVFKGDLFANIFVHYAPLDGWTITDADVQRAAADGARKKAMRK